MRSAARMTELGIAVLSALLLAASASQQTPKAQFNDARIPLSAFNETDRCLDQRALELAQE